MLLLDTHAFVWLASDQRQLSEKAKSAISEHGDALFISSISGLELGLLVKRRRLFLPLPVNEFILRALRQHHVQELPITWQIAHFSSTLPDIHNDPFDRLLIATAQLSKLTIVSKDQIIASYPGVTVLWA